MVLKVVLFLAGILALTISAHLLVYKGVIRLFIINSPGLKVSLFVILFLLSISFMASFFLLQWQKNSVTIGFYMFSAVWTGLFLNLLTAVLLSWIIIAAIRLAGTNPNTRLIAAGCLTLAILFSLYGVWNAFHPAIKNLEIEFENLPDQWKDKTIVQLSDVHLGHFYGTKFLKDLVRSVNALKPDLVFITGDLFDGMAKNISRFALELNRLKADKGVYFITGNHENYIGVNRALNVLGHTHINIIENEVIEINGLHIIGISYPGIKEVGYLTKLIYKDYDHGLRCLSKFSIYTTSGVGTWGPPMRTGNSSEIVVIKLQSKYRMPRKFLETSSHQPVISPQ